MLSVKKIEKARPQEKRYRLWDVNGLFLLVYPNGTKVFKYKYTFAGKSKEIRLGAFPGLSLKEARESHRNYLSIRKNGVDPRVLIDKSSSSDLLLKNNVDKYITFISQQNIGWKEQARVIRKDVVEVLGDIPIDKVTKADIVHLRDVVSKRGVAIANRTIAYCRGFFNFLVKEGMLETNPVTNVNKAGKEFPKTRSLSYDEIKLLYTEVKAIPRVAPETKNILMVILLTGQRPGEVTQMQGSQLDGNWWTIPANVTKNKIGDHRVYITEYVRSFILHVDDGYCFSPWEDKSTHMDLKAAAKMLRRRFSPGVRYRLSLDPFTPHDLRRTFTTRVIEMGFDEYFVGKVLNHKSRTITGTVYNQYKYDREIQEILTAWSDKIEDLFSDH